MPAAPCRRCGSRGIPAQGECARISLPNAISRGAQTVDGRQRRPVSAPSLYGSCFSIPADGSFTNASSFKSGYMAYTRSISSAWPGAEHLVRVQAPGAGHQALPAQHLVHTGGYSRQNCGRGQKNAPVAVGDGSPQRQQPCRNVPAVPVLPQFLVQLHHPAGSTPTSGPSSPPTKRSSFPPCTPGEPIGRQQIRHNVVVVAGVQGRSRPGRREAATPRTRSMLWYRLNAAQFNGGQHSAYPPRLASIHRKAVRPPQAVCK